MKSKKFSLILSVILIFLLYIISLYFTDHSKIFLALARIDTLVLVTIFLLSFINYLLRFTRWNYYIIASGYQLLWRYHFLYYLAGFTLTVTPGKAGEAVRSIYLNRHGVPYAQSFASLFVERLLDVVTMSLMALLILFSRPEYSSFIVIVWVLTLGLGWLVTREWLPEALRKWGKHHRFSRHIDHLSRLLEAASVLLCPRLLALGLVIGIGGWILEGLSFYLIAMETGVYLTFTTAIGIYAIAVLAGALSFLPGGLGSTEAVMGLLLIALGADSGTAVAVTLLCRIATLWFAVALGGLAVIILHLNS